MVLSNKEGGDKVPSRELAEANLRKEIASLSDQEKIIFFYIGAKDFYRKLMNIDQQKLLDPEITVRRADSAKEDIERYKLKLESIALMEKRDAFVFGKEEYENMAKRVEEIIRKFVDDYSEDVRLRFSVENYDTKYKVARSNAYYCLAEILGL